MSRPLVEICPGPASTRHRACCVVVDHGRLLLVERRGGGWTLPGGGVHRDESRKAAAVREAFEEAGVRVEIKGGQVLVLGTEGGGTWAFAARVKSSRRSPEGRKVRWVDPTREPWRSDPQIKQLRKAGLL